ncbi:MAG: RNA polymerase sigma factor [Berryella intestinalis]|uniref:RNA polymerase sigma factor n=1 Tax=Berryella intestinalis TaxID=1531429 RepID=UPI002A55852A|nr:RNA polymerase sigma factor [Berryella intestinalis]MDD7369799.1 RNA polymerase sigma factor [Berryella intestinalis]MDY3129893.1 RNA polymerase sigma factor [Berryella intestinalis]
MGLGGERDDEARARRAVSLYANLILRLSYTYLGSSHDAEDVCQVVLMKLLDCDTPFRDANHEKSWVVRVASNACKDLLRSRRSARTVALGEVPEVAAPEPDEAYREVLDHMMGLPLGYREALFLHYVEGYSAAEISRMQGKSESAVFKALSRGRQMIREAIEGGCDERS